MLGTARTRLGIFPASTDRRPPPKRVPGGGELADRLGVDRIVLLMHDQEEADARSLLDHGAATFDHADSSSSKVVG